MDRYLNRSKYLPLTNIISSKRILIYLKRHSTGCQKFCFTETHIIKLPVHLLLPSKCTLLECTVLIFKKLNVKQAHISSGKKAF